MGQFTNCRFTRHMGNCVVSGDDRDAMMRNKRINALLDAEKRSLDDDIKLLLLGTGGSGKSTIAKQMKIIHLTGFEEEEKEAFRAIIYVNIIDAAQTLIREAEKKDQHPADAEAARKVMAVDLAKENLQVKYNADIGNAVNTLWKDQVIQETFARSHEFLLDDSAGYFLENCVKFAEPGYVPDEKDILRARTKTTGITEIHFIVNKKNFTVVDVGGQRNERKKWIHCFQDVTAVIYCVALNEYDLLLEEDGFTNRMHESLNVFEDCVNVPYFQRIPVILFLNKKDLFEEKVKKVDPVCCFPAYEGGCDYDKASAYISKKFLSKNQNKGRKIITHFTTATDTGNVRFVFRAVENMLLQEIMREIQVF